MILFSFSLEWHPIVEKIQKHYTSYSFDSRSTKRFLASPVTVLKKVACWHFKIRRYF